ncbi:SAR2788 family putative toxin [Paenibacillus yanchengensis]|uniref:SAR2788 family putative toxin n=1 Tax=Paenibacillus yanchengensis TaxID=2035833 RepID=A0ABW4YEQ1_9BACL
MIRNLLSYRTFIAGILSVVMLFVVSVPNYSEASIANSTLNGIEFEIDVDNEAELVIKKVNGIQAKSYSTFTATDTTSDINSVEATMTLDKNTHEITLVTNEVSESSEKYGRKYNVTINAVNSYGDIDATFTDTETNTSYNVQQDKLEASLVWFIPLGVIIGEALLAQLISAALAITIGTVVYVAASDAGVLTKLRNRKDVDHYMAVISAGKVWIGNALTLAQAKYRITDPMLNDDYRNVWSRTSALAELVVTYPNKPAIGPELNVNQPIGFFFYTHYHRWDRLGGHSFF